MGQSNKQSNKQYSKWRWLLALVGLFMYLGDICTDTVLVFRYFHEKRYVWSGLTALFIITALAVNQIFSYTWFLEDMHKNVMDSKPKRRFLALHIFGMGILLRYVGASVSCIQDLQATNWNSISAAERGFLNCVAVIITAAEEN